jgi:hypothetical protein
MCQLIIASRSGHIDNRRERVHGHLMKQEYGGTNWLQKKLSTSKPT